MLRITGRATKPYELRKQQSKGRIELAVKPSTAFSSVTTEMTMLELKKQIEMNFVFDQLKLHFPPPETSFSSLRTSHYKLR